MALAPVRFEVSGGPQFNTFVHRSVQAMGDESSLKAASLSARSRPALGYLFCVSWRALLDYLLLRLAGWGLNVLNLWVQ
jgi:hypothetical protein